MDRETIEAGPSLGPVFRSLLPSGVELVDTWSISTARLLPAEERYIANAPPRRRADFIAGRLCARDGLRRLGVEDFALLCDEDRAPIWPADITGSITHTHGYCAAVVARRSVLDGIGIDVERIGRFSENLWQFVCTPLELNWLYQQPIAHRSEFAAAIFSAKEAVYKCQYPMTRQWLGFGDVEVELWEGTFVIELLPQMPSLESVRSSLTGRYAVQDGFVMSVATSIADSGLRSAVSQTGSEALHTGTTARKV
jgi:4'-phosphopantetheinyl transferase EntD